MFKPGASADLRLNDYDGLKPSWSPFEEYTQASPEIFSQDHLPEDPSLRAGATQAYHKDRLLNFSSDLEYIKNLKRFEKMKMLNGVNLRKDQRVRGLNHKDHLE